MMIDNTTSKRFGDDGKGAPDNVITPALPPGSLLLALAGFRRDERLWPRRGLDPERVRELRGLYEDGGDTALPPLLVAQVERRRFLADGWQRCAAAEALGWTALPAIVREVARVEDVYLEALAAVNDGDRPLTLTRVEKRDAADRLLRLVSHYSDRAIARMAGVSQPFVSARRRRLDTGEGEGRADEALRLPSRQEAVKILAAAARLLKMERTGWLCTDGIPVDAGAALREAARARGAAADALLEQLQRWVEHARRGRHAGAE